MADHALRGRDHVNVVITDPCGSPRYGRFIARLTLAQVVLSASWYGSYVCCPEAAGRNVTRAATGLVGACCDGAERWDCATVVWCLSDRARS